jgi:hypothetical protein
MTQKSQEKPMWVLRYKIPSKDLSFKPKVKIPRPSTGLPPFEVYSETRVDKATGLSYPTIELPEEWAYKVLSKSDKWDLWSPSEVTVGIFDGIKTVSKRIVSVAAERELEAIAQIEVPPTPLKLKRQEVMNANRAIRTAKLAAAKAQAEAEGQPEEEEE